MEAKFCVGYDGNLKDLRKILNSSSKIESVYTGGLAGKIHGGRPQYLKSFNGLYRQIEYAHKRNVFFEMAINAPCGMHDKSDKRWWNVIKNYIKRLEAIGIDRVIVSHPFIIDIVKSYTKMELVISTICEIMNVRSALHYECLGADIITPSMNINKNIKELKLIKDNLKKAKLRIMLNEQCIDNCPWRRFHYNHYSHSNNQQDYRLQCREVYLRYPYLLLSNNAIRPEDLKYYVSIADSFKIIGRLIPIEYLITRVTAYSAESFDGNFLDLINHELSSVYYIPNKKLDGVINKIFNCNKVCIKCNYCKTLFEKIGVKVLPDLFMHSRTPSRVR